MHKTSVNINHDIISGLTKHPHFGTSVLR